MNRSQVESFSFPSFISIPNRSRRNILEQSILLCSLLSSPSLMFFFNRIHFSQLSYCLLTATLEKGILIAPKKGTPTPSGFLMNNHHSLACTTHNGAQHRVYNRRGILPSTAQGKSSFWERRPELSHTLQALHHSCRVLSPLHLGPGFQSRYRESREV